MDALSILLVVLGLIFLVFVCMALGYRAICLVIGPDRARQLDDWIDEGCERFNLLRGKD